MTGLTGVTQVAAGDGQSLALRSDGTVWAWGANSDGELGDHTTAEHDSPEPVPGLSGIVRIATGLAASYAISASGTLYAWGADVYGVLDPDPGAAGYATPVPGLAGVTQVASSGGTTLAVAGSNGQVWAWGENNFGQLGDGSTANNVNPEPIGLTGITSVAEGGWSSAAVRSDGTEFTWGGNTAGQLGLGTPAAPTVLRPVANPWLNGVTQVAMGWSFGLAVGRCTAATVPSVLGQTTAQANSTLSAAGLHLGTITDVVDNTCNHIGRIMSQTPAAGTTAQLGSSVAITVGTRPLKPCP